jgi:hypothetical protein
MAILFLWLRLCNFGAIIFKMWFGNIGEHNGGILSMAGFHICRVFVLGLLICHIYWFRKIAKAAYRMFAIGPEHIRDNRSDEASMKKKVQ